jgi:5-methylcytosine-specific restriction endonuclease McrA
MATDVRTEELRTMDYREYLKTEEWAARRRIVLKRGEWRCQLCNSSRELHIHHRTYERRGNERLADLIVLCRVCHTLFHEHRKLVVE